MHQLQESNSREANPLSVKLELQADCFAGVWAHSTQQRGLLEKGDVESALGAASAVGDDRLQKMSTGHVSPESFTHGSSQQRMRWFNTGLDNGTIAACNTFAKARPPPDFPPPPIPVPALGTRYSLRNAQRPEISLYCRFAAASHAARHSLRSSP